MTLNRYLTEDAEDRIRTAVDKLGNEVFSYIDTWTDSSGRTNAQIVLNGGTRNIPWRMDEWANAMGRFCEFFDIRNGEAIVLYNIHEKWLEPVGSYDLKSRWNSRKRFVPFLKRRK